MDKSNVSPYQEALNWIEKHPGTGSASGMAKLILSLWNSECAFSFRECTYNLDANLTQVALRVVSHFAQYGENEELIEIGHKVCKEYPAVWDLGQAADNAKNALRRKWREEDEARREKEEIES